MELYGRYSKSIPQKIVIHGVELVLLWLSYQILFRQGGPWLRDHWHIHYAANSSARRTLLFAFNVIIFHRFAYMMFFLQKRRIPWVEGINIPFAFAIYYIAFSLFVLPASQPIDALDIFAMTLFVTGCICNTAGEMLRDRWKKRPENKGKLYTKGLFRYSRHINYFGDILWVAADALLTRNPYAAVIPLFLFCLFAFFNVPLLEKYLRYKYGRAYENYARRTKMPIPFVY